ncbi:pre-toxin TG domain-containing protein [Agrobacterium tumefaciens]|uniref:pre-toxin TG domain-containing protein n=1 Tax=Agrobacterium tumefaciens TaxID=358 RepID=UPI0015720FE1|nr:pre-toxin TG domain-containing protein [Agrobacterium tumefaciens]NTA19303.1 hypothetical protein [Agrobacterium tumefaciens]WCK74793.1 pre-toxin TG domain-containing protein [Agrobacterium tumefaciens]
MSRTSLSVLMAAVGIFVVGSQAMAACEPKFGDQIYTWVDRRVAEQSYQLTSADYNARIFNYFLLSYDDLNKRVLRLHEQLDAISASINQSESSNEPNEVKRSVKREASAVALLNQLFEARSELNVTKMSLVNLTELPSEERFRLDGFGNIGRATLLASLLALGETAQKSLAGRFSVYIEYSFDESGSVRGAKVKREADMVDVMLTTGTAYLPTPYAVAVVLLYQIGKLVYEDRICEKRVENQLAIMRKAYELLPSKLISHDAQFRIFESAYQEQIRSFSAVASKLEAETEQSGARWRDLFAYNASRSAAANAILTPAKVRELEREFQTSGDLRHIFENIAISRFAERITDLNSYLSSQQVKLLSACNTVGGIRTTEDQQDALSYGLASLEVFDSKAAFVPLQPLIRRSAQLLASELDEAIRIRGGLKTKPCPKGVVGSGATPSTRLNSISGVAGAEPLSARAETMAVRPPSAGFSFCVLVRNGNVYACGDPRTGGAAYGSQFDTSTGDPRQDVLNGANDGGFAADDRKVGSDIEGVIKNVDDRIAQTNIKIFEAQAALPAWKQQNGAAIDLAIQDSQINAAVDSAAAAKFSLDNAPLVAAAQNELKDFLQQPADPARITELLKAVDAADLSLSMIPANEMPVEVPSLPGLTAVDRAFTPGASSEERFIERERLKLESAHGLTLLQRKVAKSALDAAEQMQRGGAPGNLVRSLTEDSAAIRYAASGELADATLTFVREDGTLYRQAVVDLSSLPPDTLVARAQAFNDTSSVFASRTRSLHDIFDNGGGSGLQRRSLNFAESLAASANTTFYSGDVVSGAEMLRVAMIVLDVATAVTPGISWGRDIYESFTGKNLITGEELSSFERTIAVLGAITGGVAGGGPKLLRALEKAGHIGKSGAEAEHIVQAASRIDSMAVEWTTHAKLELNDADMIVQNIGKDEVDDALDRGTRFFDTDKGTILSYEQDVVGRKRAAAGVDPDSLDLVTVFPEERTDAALARVLSETRPDRRRFIKLGDD